MTIRLIAFVNRLPHISFEEFDRHWTNHGALLHACLTPVKNGAVRYKQFHKDPEMSLALEKMGLAVPQYDGVAEWEAETLQELFEIFVSDEFKEHLAPDETKFFHREAVQVMAGRDKSDFTDVIYKPGNA